MKKVMLSVFVLFCMWMVGNSQIFATEWTSSSGFNTVIKDESFNFKAVYEAGKVYMSWTAYNKDESLKYYKIVRSSKNENPAYPEDGYIKYSNDINLTKWVDLEPPLWYAYYRICAITTENNRYCSNVAKVITKTENTSTTTVTPTTVDIESPTACTMEYAPVCWKVAIQCITTPCEPIKQTFGNKCMLKANPLATYLYQWECKVEEPSTQNTTTSNTKIKAKGLIDSFIIKLEKKGFNNEQKVTVINTIITKLTTLKETKPSLKEVINYLITLLEEKKAKYQNDFSEIEKIFSDF